MENRLFKEEEDIAFTAMVLEYNRMKQQGDEGSSFISLENKVRERTSLLLYLIPMRNLYLRKEEAGGFFLDIQKDIDWIISSFRISGLTYNMYLSQICRYRVMRYTKRNHNRKNMDRAISFSDPTIYEYPVKEKCVPYQCKAEDVSDMDLAGLSKHIIHAQDKGIMVLSEAERKLSELLRRTIKRRQFISYLLSLPETETPGFIAGVSRLLRNDISTISRFYTLRHEYLAENNEKTLTTLELIASRHWKVMMKLRRAIWLEADEEKRNILLDKYMKLSNIYNRRREQIAKAHGGLSHREISDLLGISRSTVTYDIQAMRKALERISESV